MSNKSVMQQAHELIHGQRASDYGDALENFSHIAMGFSFVLGRKLNAPVTAEEVAMMMQTLKMSRLTQQPDHLDSLVDNLGYGGCYDKIRTSRRSGKPLKGILQ